MNIQTLQSWLSKAQVWAQAEVLTTSTGIQAGIIVVAFMIALAITVPAKRIYPKLFAWLPAGWRDAVVRHAGELSLPLMWLLLQLLAQVVALSADWDADLLNVTVSLLTAWVVIRIASLLIHDQTWGRFFAVVAWTVAALNIAGLLDPALKLLDSASLKLGDVNISALTVIKGVITLIVLLWFASVSSRLLEQRVKALPNLTPSVQVLIGKMIKIVLITIAILAAIDTVGVDLTVLAVFSGAVGVGLGFGLQKVVSNFISGIILLLDQSVKPGDTIAVSGYYGKVDSLGARYASVITRDGIEHLIPNEEFITTRVENWSYSQDLLRLKIQVGIHYDSDVREAIELCLDAAKSVPRILDEPKSVCLVHEFGNSAVILEVRFWINDPMNGRANVTSELLLGIWDRFHEHGIKIPYPQRELHIKSDNLARFQDDDEAVPDER